MFGKILKLYKRMFWQSERYARYLGVAIGSDCSISTKAFGSEPYLISIGNNVQITNEVKFFNHGGGWVFRNRYPLFDFFGKISIGNNVYVGNRSLIMPGVIIGNNVIVGAGSVVTKSIADNLIVAGNPAKIVGMVSDLENRMLAFNLDTKGMSSKEKERYLLSLPKDRFIVKDFITG